MEVRLAERIDADWLFFVSFDAVMGFLICGTERD